MRGVNTMAMVMPGGGEELMQAVKDLVKRRAAAAGCVSGHGCWCSAWRQHVRGGCTHLRDGGLVCAQTRGGLCVNGG